MRHDDDANLLDLYLLEIEPHLQAIKTKVQSISDALSRNKETSPEGLRLNGPILSISGNAINLSGKEKLLHLVQLFVDAEAHTCAKDLLLRTLYNPENRELSFRQTECLQQNLVKLISRARQEMSQRCSAANYEWFPYSPNIRSWRLYQLRGSW